MGWGCYKHEWDAGSEAWKAAEAKLAKRKLAEKTLTFGRNGHVCPACHEGLESDHLALKRIAHQVRVAFVRGENLDSLIYSLGVRLDQ